MKSSDFASIKVSRPFLAWLKVKAAQRGIPLYELLEELVARGMVRPWVKAVSRRDGAT